MPAPVQSMAMVGVSRFGRCHNMHAPSHHQAFAQASSLLLSWLVELRLRSERHRLWAPPWRAVGHLGPLVAIRKLDT
eukprot:scaffold329293_cov57-Tisochrysis_lutea.AAC.1